VFCPSILIHSLYDDFLVESFHRVSQKVSGREVGYLDQEPSVCQPGLKGETKAQKKKRPYESQVWEHSGQAMGMVPENQLWIDVDNRGSEISTFWQACQHLGYDVVICVAQDCRTGLEQEGEEADPTIKRLKALARSFPALDGQAMHIPARRPRPARDACVQISWSDVRISQKENKRNGHASSIQCGHASTVSWSAVRSPGQHNGDRGGIRMGQPPYRSTEYT
jgi:hypothetical protein